MKKTFKSYIGIWAICLALFNVIAFIIPKDLKENFWVGYIFITLAFAGQLFCANKAFKAENAQKLFYNFPIISISSIGTVIMLAVGGLTMAISPVPVWIGIILCAVVLAFSAISIISASVVSETVSKSDTKIKTLTLFVKTLTADAEVLMSKAQSDELRVITKKVYETIRYSDPMSADVLRPIESEIIIKFREFEKAVLQKSQNTVSIGEELITLIRDINVKCKLLK